MENPWEKSQTVNPEVRAYVYSLVSAVGGQDTLEERYAIGDDAHAVLSDLIRWLRLFDEKTNRFDVKRCLAEANLVKGDLLEILAQWPESAQENRLKAKLATACLQLLVPLTWPIELDAQKTTYNHLRHKPYIQLAQVGYKRAVLHFEDAPILRTIVRIGLSSMATPRRERSKRDEGVLKMMLYFFRNIAMITQPQQLPSQGDENEISRSTTIEIFSQQEVFNLLLTIGSGAQDEFQDQDAVVLETLFHLLKGVDPKKLFMRQEQVVSEETNELQELMKKERAMHKSYNKHAPTRHNRFGTMLWVKREDQKMSTVSGQNSITNERAMLQQMDTSKKWNKPKYKGKMTHEFNETDDFGMRVDLTEKARACLKTFVEDFLDSSFNPLFASLRKAIAGEADRLVDKNKRQYYYLISWFLSAESARRDQTRAKTGCHADRPSQAVEENTFAYIAAVLDQETFVLLSRQMQSAYDNKEWQNLQSCLLCFTQILLTVNHMADSTDEEDQEIAENIQSRIFYEEATHDLLLQILRGYTNQGFPYLDAVTECVHVFIRMLERYAKQNVDLQIRSKRRARKKQKKPLQASNANDNDDTTVEDAEAENDQQEAFRAVSERKFDFARLTAKLLNQGSVNTYIAFMHFYADLSPSQLKRCHRFFYRLAFKNELAILLFRVDILALFQRMIKGPDGLRQDIEGYRDWEELVRQVFRRCIKWIEREPADGADKDSWREAMVVEMLFSKVPNTIFYLQNGFDRVVEKRAPRPPAEMEVKASVEEGKRVGVVVSVLLEQGKGDAIEWVKRQVSNAEDERRAWGERNATTVQRDQEGEISDPGAATATEAPSTPTIFLTHDTDERKEALFKDKFLRLLLTTFGCQRLGTAEDTDAPWIIPSDVTADQLKVALESIKRAEQDGVELEEGQTALDCLRNKSSASRHAAFEEPDSNASEGDLDAPLFPPNLREKRKAVEGEEAPKKKRRLTKRNTKEFTEEELQDRAKERKQKEREKNAKIKSALFVTESDDESDEEKDAEFFRLEAERRKKTGALIRKTLKEVAEKEGVDGGVGPRRKKTGSKAANGKKRAKKAVAAHSDEDVETGEEDAPVQASSTDEEASATDDDTAPRTQSKERNQAVLSEDEESAEGQAAARTGGWQSISDFEDEDEGTPSTSPPARPLSEVSGNASKRSVLPMEVEDEEDKAPVKPVAPAARRRAAFIVEDDSDED